MLPVDVRRIGRKSITRFYLSVIFKQNFDQTFSEYLLAYRLERGKELLVSTGISVGTSLSEEPD